MTSQRPRWRERTRLTANMSSSRCSLPLHFTLQTWTANVLEARGKAKITESEFNAYCGLELAMSIWPLNEISEYWSESRFLGQPAFIETMPRTRFQAIRATLQFHAPDDQTLDKINDPLWHSRTMLAYF
ncbi:LOW QUALITY PROTEIN: hypothetical protein PHMEG_00033816 [Phytophthora megakarya]|uniref:PiggyBac transposable element-derived protein domain-containing protein n=1 Tax=Phytophthora megakarya TaxID=4795 RepID=A0A225UU20_9STRA|nr:LOW QUALITY PROTEIN: hypothetical protein PHMEG_00033816 [Phytophthora megakarya]